MNRRSLRSGRLRRQDKQGIMYIYVQAEIMECFRRCCNMDLTESLQAPADILNGRAGAFTTAR